MSQSVPMEPFEPGENNPGEEAVADFARQSREFLAKGKEYLAAGDLHQASEKGWGAAAWMAKAVAEARGWQYKRHDEFFTVMRQAQDLSGDSRLRNLRRAANELHGYYYTRRIFLHSDDIGQGLDEVAFLLDILQPLTEPDAGGASADS